MRWIPKPIGPKRNDALPRHDEQCLRCPWEGEVWVAPGEYPPCPNCGGATERLWRRSPTVIADEIPGGLTVENLGHDPVTVYSKSELAREAKARGLEPFVRHVPIPGTDRSPHTTDWSRGTDPQTLANAEALVARVGRPSTPEPLPTRLQTVAFTVRELPTD